MANLPAKRLNDEQKSKVIIRFFHDLHSVKEISDELKVPKFQIYNFIRSKAVRGQLNFMDRRYAEKQMVLRHKILDYAEEAVDRLDQRAKNKKVCPELKTKIDLALIDRSPLGPKMEIKVDKRIRHTVGSDDLDRVNSVLGEFGEREVIDAEIEEENDKDFRERETETQTESP